MKKRIFLYLLVILGMFAITGCDSTKKVTKATIIDNEGNTVEMTYDELKSVWDENNQKFIKYYKNANISFDGVVEKVLSGQICPLATSLTSVRCDVINFKDGWYVYLKKNKHDLSEISKGDVINVSTKIYVEDYNPYTFSIHRLTVGRNIGDYSDSLYDATEITILK